jgi:hypothetical protein
VKVFYDCEFLENGKTIDLISIGMVSVDGNVYYAVNAEMNWGKVLQHDWLRANVLPHLPTRTFATAGTGLDHAHPTVKTRAVIRAEVEEFLLAAAIASGTESQLELWSWFGAYDHVVLMQLWGTMLERPSFVPMYTNDIKQEFRRLGDPAVPGHLTQDNMPGAHNALADAYYHQRLYNWIEERARQRQD